MTDSTRDHTAQMTLTEEDLEKLRRVARNEQRSISNLIYIIVMPEIQRRLAASTVDLKSAHTATADLPNAA